MAAIGPEPMRSDHRRAVHLTGDTIPRSHPTLPLQRQATAPTRRTLSERFMLFAERVLGRLAPTLRMALVIAAVVVVGIVVLAVTVGVFPAMFSAGLAGIALVSRSR